MKKKNVFNYYFEAVPFRGTTVTSPTFYRSFQNFVFGIFEYGFFRVENLIGKRLRAPGRTHVSGFRKTHLPSRSEQHQSRKQKWNARVCANSALRSEPSKNGRQRRSRVDRATVFKLFLYFLFLSCVRTRKYGRYDIVIIVIIAVVRPRAVD